MEQHYPNPIVRQIVAEVRELIRTEVAALQQSYLRPDQAAAYLGVSKEMLQTLRQTKKGPRFSKPMPQVVLYHRDDLDTWARSNIE